MKDAEHRIGIYPIDEALAKRAAWVKEAAPLWAKYGGAEPPWKSVRDNLLATLAMKHRGKAQDEGAKITETQITQHAQADEEFTGFIATVLTERERLFVLQNEIDGINHQIMRANVVASYAKGELAL